MKAKMKTPSIAGTGGGRREGTSGSTAAVNHSTSLPGKSRRERRTSTRCICVIVPRVHFSDLIGELRDGEICDFFEGLNVQLEENSVEYIVAIAESTDAFLTDPNQLSYAIVRSGVSIEDAMAKTFAWLEEVGVYTWRWATAGDDAFYDQCNAVLSQYGEGLST